MKEKLEQLLDSQISTLLERIEEEEGGSSSCSDLQKSGRWND
jgi:hypothetical protein